MTVFAGNGLVQPAADTADAVAAPARPALRRAAAAAVARQHWLAIVLLLAGLVLRVLAQLAYRPALLYIDSVKYLRDSQGNDPEGYKAPLRAILFVANLNTVAAVQHLLGLAMAVAIYVLLLRRGASRWLAALAIAPLLLDGYQLQQEQTIMPTTWFEALIVAGLAILLWRPDPGWRRVVAAGLVLGTSATFAQVGEALVLPAVIFLLAVGGGWRWAVGRAAALCVAFALPIAAYCTGSYLATGQFALSHQGVTSLYGRTAAAVDCATIRLTAAERAICPAAAQQAHGDDWLAFNPAAPVQAIYRSESRAAVDSTITTFDSRVLSQQPLRVLDAYGRDVLKLFAVTRQTAPGDPPITRWQFAKSFPYFTPHASKQEVSGIVRQFGGGQPMVWRPVADFLHHYQLDGGYSSGPLLVLFTITGLAGSLVLVARRRLDPRSRQLALGCLLFFGSAVFVLLVSDLFVFSWRYQIPALVTLVPAGALGLNVLVNMVGARRTPV
ncbi:MAG: hypothetical protein ACRDOK_02350 [Streptosporangiaceae bacterium]